MVLVEVSDKIGTCSPTCSEAVWLFSTISFGAETTLILVSVSSAFSVAAIEEWE